ncbi:hypothetical protein D3C79_732650 [compost metagenome]
MSREGCAMVGLVLVLVMLSDTDLAKRVRSGVVTASLLLAMLNGDSAAVLQFLQLQV